MKTEMFAVRRNVAEGDRLGEAPVKGLRATEKALKGRDVHIFAYALSELESVQ